MYTCQNYVFLKLILLQSGLAEDDNTEKVNEKKKGQKKAKKMNRSKANQRKGNKKLGNTQSRCDLSEKIYTMMEKFKDVFFVVRLHSVQSAVSLGVRYSIFSFLYCGFELI